METHEINVSISMPCSFISGEKSIRRFLDAGGADGSIDCFLADSSWIEGIMKDYPQIIMRLVNVDQFGFEESEKYIRSINHISRYQMEIDRTFKTFPKTAMRLWELGSKEDIAEFDQYETFESHIVRATCEEEARQLASKAAGREGKEVWFDSKKTSCQWLSVDGEAGVLMSEYNG